MRLLHIHLPKQTPYQLASSIQSHLLALHTTSKLASKSILSIPPSIPPSPPPPTLLTFTTPPTYTVGRRYLTRNPLPPAQITYLTPISPHAHKPLATFYPTSRGGDLTYHAPGQLTAYLILNLRTHHLKPREYVRLLESTVISTCAALNVPNTTTTSDPGVWIRDTDRKICAVGIRIQSGLTSHGVGLNVFDRPCAVGEGYMLEDNETPAAGYLSWGFRRIIACGLEGKSVTWLSAEGADTNLREEEVGSVLAQELARRLSREDTVQTEGVDRMSDEEVKILVDRGRKATDEEDREAD